MTHKIFHPRCFSFFLFILLFIPCAVFAGTTGKIAGKVTNAATGEPLIGVNIIIEGTIVGAATDIDGNYIILNIPPGTYIVRASAVGFQPVRTTDVKVFVDLTTRLDFKLQEATIQAQEVVVTAERPLIQRDLTSTAAKIGSDQIQQLPVEDVQSLINLQAGVVEGHFRGGRSGEVAYLIDGVSVNDVFTGHSALQVENNAVQEIEVISGTFNAEYGQAMSGVVNVVTKEGGEKYTGEVSSYVGNYVSSHTDVFQNLDRIDPSNIFNLQGSLSGPIPGLENFANLFVSGRYYNNQGYIYGKRVFNPSDSSNFDRTPWNIQATGDGKYVPMNPDERISAQGKMTLKLFSSDKLNIEGVYQKTNYREYDHNFRLNPDGDYQRHRLGVNLALGYTRALSATSFVNAKFSGLFSTYKQYVYEDPFDSRYVNPQRLMQRPADTFYTGGTEMWHYNHETRTYVAKVDYTNQITNTHLIKAGLEGKFHRLWSHDFQIRLDATTGYKAAMPDPTATDNLEYLHHPIEGAFYIQDKMEFDYLIMNIGLRYDYFKPDDVYPENPDQLPYTPLLDASAKQQLSPRFGLAYPITDRGVIHVSYGHFFQIPPFDYLYTNPGFKIVVAGQLSTLQGNADLKPQQTTAYEVGLQQQLSDDLAIDITAYYKDIRNLLGTEIHDYLNGAARFARYINRDYGNVKGITVAFEKRFLHGLGATINYTYQIARGNASDPQSVYLDNQTSPPRESTKQLVPLDWDRTHSLNFTVTIGKPDDYNISLIGRLGSGLPYTPSQSTYRMALENSENKPTVTNFDLYAYKILTLFGAQISVFLKVYNLFDTMNELNVFTDTGRSGHTLSMLYDPQPQGVNTLKEYFTRPDFYSAPRQVILGFSFGF